MGLMDGFRAEDRTEVKFSDFYELMKEAAKAELMMNGIKCDTPHAYMREMMTGKREEAAHAESEISVHIKPIICGIDTGRGESKSNLPWETPEQEQEKHRRGPRSRRGNRTRKQRKARVKAWQWSS